MNNSTNSEEVIHVIFMIYAPNINQQKQSTVACINLQHWGYFRQHQLLMSSQGLFQSAQPSGSRWFKESLDRFLVSVHLPLQLFMTTSL